MSQDRDDLLLRAYARLDGLKRAIDAQLRNKVEKKYVDDYHSVLDGLERNGEHLQEFKVPAEELARRLDGGNYLTGEEIWSEELYVDRALLMAKLDGLLGYFKLRTERRIVRLDLPKDTE